MKKFVRKVKTFDPKGTQTPPGELYILDKVKGGPPDQEGGGLVRELPSKLIGRLRSDLKFAAVLQSGVSKNNGKLKDEMAAITRSAYVSKSIARERLGQVLKQKVSRGRESIQFFKHNLAKQKVASLKAAKVRVHDENLQLKTRVERRNHELSVQAMAMQAMGAVSSLDERTLNNKDVEITDLKAIVQKLHSDLQDERRRSEYIAKKKDDTQTQLYRAYSTLGKLAMKSGKASDKALMYELDDVNELPTYMDEEDESNKMEEEEEEEMERRMTILLTPETKTKRRPSSAQPNSRKSRGSRRHLGASSRGVAATTSPTATSPTTKTTSTKRRRRPSSAHSRSTTRKRKQPHPYLHNGRKYGPQWQTPVGLQGATTFPKSPAPKEPSIVKLDIHPTTGKRKLKIRAGVRDCYSEEHLAALLSSTMALPEEFRPNNYFPPPPNKGWQQLMKEENDRLESKHKEERQHNYVRWRPEARRGSEMPTTSSLQPSPLRLMVDSDPRSVKNHKSRGPKLLKRRTSIDSMADWLERSRNRTLEIEGPGLTGEKEDGIEEGPNLLQPIEQLPVPTNQKEIEALELQEKEEIMELYAIKSQHQEYPNPNRFNLFQFDEKRGKYRHVHHQLKSSVAGEQRRAVAEEAAAAKAAMLARESSSNSSGSSLPRASLVSKTVKRKKMKRRPKSAASLRKNKKREDNVFTRLMNTTGSKFAGPGGCGLKERHVVKTSGSARYQRERMAQKIKQKAADNAHDKD